VSRHICLLVALLLLLIVHPFVDARVISVTLVDILLALTLMTATLAATEPRSLDSSSFAIA